MNETQVVVGRIGRAHGIRGEVSVEPRTDEPERRFAVGAVLDTEAPRGGAPHGPGRPSRLTIRTLRWHQSRLLVTFAEIPDRTAAETARGLLLVATVAAEERPEDPEEFYDHQLVGLRVVTTDGAGVGTLAEVVHGAAQDLLVVRTEEGREVLVPFVSALVPVVDLAAGRVEVADRPGLLNELPDEPGA
ncbi:MAG: ribosome maturation factor RimM [Nocardioidaceae bacterium]